MAFDSTTVADQCENSVFSNGDRTLTAAEVVQYIGAYPAEAISELTLTLDGVATDYKVYFEVSGDDLTEPSGYPDTTFGFLLYTYWVANRCTDPACNCGSDDAHSFGVTLAPNNTPYTIATTVRGGYPGSFSGTDVLADGDVFGVAVWLKWDVVYETYGYKVWLSKNGTWYSSGDPTDWDDAGVVITGEIDPATDPYVKIYVRTLPNLQATEQFGAANLSYTPPAGYTDFDTLSDTSPFYRELDDGVGVDATEEPLRQTFMTSEVTAGFSPLTTGGYGFPLSEDYTFSDVVYEIEGKSISESLGVSPSLASNAIQVIAIAALSGLSDLPAVSFRASVDDSAGFDDAFVIGIGNVLASAFGLSPSLSSQLQAYRVIDDVPGLHDETGYGFYLTADAAIGVAVDYSLLYAFSLVLSDEAGADDAPAAAVGFIHVVSDQLGVDEAPSTIISAIESVSDAAALGGLLRLPDAEYVAWVVNSENLALSRYSGYSFNSLAAFKTTYLGATDTGIYELEGADDAGTDIDARIRTGLMEFGSSRQKAMPSAYLGYTADGSLGLKVITTEGGTKTETWYKLTETKGAPDTSRIKVGKGLKARYWGFELSNVDGSDFEVDHLHLYPVILTRRI